MLKRLPRCDQSDGLYEARNDESDELSVIVCRTTSSESVVGSSAERADLRTSRGGVPEEPAATGGCAFVVGASFRAVSVSAS